MSNVVHAIDRRPEKSTASGNLHDHVLRLSLASYRTSGERAIARWDTGYATESTQIPDIVLPLLRRVEEIETEESFTRADPSRYAAFRDRGLEVWVLVPLDCLSEAHSRFRGAVDRIQGWWVEGSRICFGRAEQP